MPTLKDTEWRLLCVIVRQTFGWQVDGRRKQRDWLTQSQLMVKTGRNNQAISRALDQLVRQGLVAVQDQGGQLLLSAAERRRYCGRLYYGLGADLSDVGRGARSVRRETGPGFARTDLEPGKITQQNGQSPVGKPHTTKQTVTKYLSNDKAPARSWPSKESLRQTRDQPNPQVRHLLYQYRELFRQHSPLNEPPPIAWGRDGKLARDLLRLYAYDRLMTLLEQFFQTPDAWPKKRGYTLTAFRDSLPALLMGDHTPASRGHTPASSLVHRPTPSCEPAVRTGKWTRVGQVKPLPIKPIRPYSPNSPRSL